VKSRDDLHLRRIDIVSWDSPVAKQHRIARLPYLRMYEGGKIVADGTEAVLGRARQAPAVAKPAR